MVALLGPNGAGKTTLLRMLATLHRPDRGELTVLGHRLPDHAARARRGIGYLGHDPLVYLDLTPWQNLRLFADLYGAPRDRDRLEALLDRVGLLPRAYDVVRTFSRGMVQRLGVARLLLHDPKLLLLDEPTAGLDAPGGALLDSVLAEGRTTVVVTHDVEWAARRAHQLLVLRGGRLVETIDPAGHEPAVVRTSYERLVGA